MPELCSKPPSICTIVASNYLAHARTLVASFKAQHPDGQAFVLLVDRASEAFDPASEPFTLIEAEKIRIPGFLDMAFRYSILELSTAVKPFFLEFLFATFDLDQLVYFDPDIVIYAPITLIFEALKTAAVVLTPHLLEPLLEDGCAPSELDILRSGVYNLGFIAVRRSASLLPLLHWWQRKLEKDCVHAVEKGLFVDQRWADLIPAYVEHTTILRHSGLNVAYWNLAQRQISCNGAGWQVNDQPLVFYHFSGVDLSNLEGISRFQNRYTLLTRPELRLLFEDYRERLISNGYEQMCSLPYTYATFDHGVAIPEAARRLWTAVQYSSGNWKDPFNREGAFFAYLIAPAIPDDQSRLRLTNLALAVYNLRPDVQAVYPKVYDQDRLAYLNWFVTDGAVQLKLDPILVQPVAASLPSISNQIAQVILGRKPMAPMVEQPLSGPPTWRRRLYYAIRNPLRRLGLHRLARRLVGEQRANTIHERMVKRNG